ncbi:MAG: zf-HC2 domain-containing protein [Firmicutes bacterium]|nr:zf-HC2 domain-containing protein [Bacillota bacterium]
MNCHRVQNLLSAYLDQELSSEERRLVRNHIFHCPVCSESYEELNKIKYFLGNLEPPTPEIEPVFKFSLTHPEPFGAGSAHYNTLFWGKRLLLTGSCVFLFLLTSFSLFPETNPTGVARQQEEGTPFIRKSTRYQIVRQQNPNLLVVDSLKELKEEKKEEEKFKPWWEDNLHLPVVPVSHK